VTDPTETRRAAFAAAPSTTDQLRHLTAEASDLTQALLETRQALAASQADLTTMQEQRDETRAVARDIRAAAERNQERLDCTRRELAKADLENRRLAAELGSALRRLNEQRADMETVRAQLAHVVQYATAYEPGVIVVARQDVGVCVLCGRPIVRGQGVEAVPDTTEPQWKHAKCPNPEEVS